MFPSLLRHSLLVGDARALTQWLARGGRPECGASLAFPGDPSAALGVLTTEQIAALAAAPPLDGPALRAAQACTLAVCGADAASSPDARLAQAAAAHAAFRETTADFEVHELAPYAFAVTRRHGAQRVLCLANVTPLTQLVPIPWRRMLGSANVRDLLGGARLAVHGPSFQLGPWDVRWLGN